MCSSQFSGIGIHCKFCELDLLIDKQEFNHRALLIYISVAFVCAAAISPVVQIDEILCNTYVMAPIECQIITQNGIIIPIRIAADRR